MWNGNKYEAPGYSKRSGFSYGKLMHRAAHEVQRYLLFVDLSSNTIKSLERLQALGLPKWQKIVAEQLGSFMRDRLTLLAFPYLLASKTTQSVKEIIALSNAHDLRSALQNAVISPLSKAIEQHELTDESLRGCVNDAISCVTHFTRHLTLLLDGCTDLMNPQKRLSNCTLNKETLIDKVKSDSLNLSSFGELPIIEVGMSDEEDVTILLPERTVFALLHLLLANTIDAMREANLNLSEQKVKLNINTDRGAMGYCRLIVWNSGTKFRKDVINHGGVEFETARPQKNRAGIGLYVVNTILGYAKAKTIDKGRHMIMENTEDPTGARIEIQLPVAR